MELERPCDLDNIDGLILGYGNERQMKRMLGRGQFCSKSTHTIRGRSSTILVPALEGSLCYSHSPLAVWGSRLWPWPSLTSQFATEMSGTLCSNMGLADYDLWGELVCTCLYMDCVP